MSPVLTAILEITLMLAVAFGLGVLLARNIWRQKLSVVKADLEKSNKEKEKIHSEMVNLKAEYSAYQKGKEVEMNELQTQIDNQVKEKNKILNQFQEAEKTHEEEMIGLKSELQRARQELQQESKARVKEKELIQVRLDQLIRENEELSVASEQGETARKRKKHQAYYRLIGDKKYDDAALKIAEKAVSGKGDGRISKEDADRLFEVIADSNQYTDIEKRTIKYIREHFTWTPEADQSFRQRVAEWSARKSVT